VINFLNWLFIVNTYSENRIFHRLSVVSTIVWVLCSTLFISNIHPVLSVLVSFLCIILPSQFAVYLRRNSRFCPQTFIVGLISSLNYQNDRFSPQTFPCSSIWSFALFVLPHWCIMSSSKFSYFLAATYIGSFTHTKDNTTEL